MSIIQQQDADRHPDVAIFAATSGHSGVDRIFKNLVPWLGKSGYRVDVLTIEGHGPSLQDLPDMIRVLNLGTRHVASALPPLVRYLRKHRPEALLTDKDRVNRTACLARRLAGGPTRLYLRLGTNVSTNLASRGFLDRWTQKLSMRYLYAQADGLLFPAKSIADDFICMTGLKAEKVKVVPSPIVKDDIFSKGLEPAEHPWFRNKTSPVVLGVGELSGRKNFEMLVKAVAQVQETRTCRLILLGKGKRRASLKSLSEKLGIADRVDLPGFVENPYPFIASADVVVVSSRWEGLAVVLIEALALGTPVISTDCPSGHRDVLRNGSIGFLIPIDDHSGMAQAIFKTLNDPVPQKTLQEAARPYEIERSTQAYLEAMGFVSSARR